MIEFKSQNHSQIKQAKESHFILAHFEKNPANATGLK